MQCISMFPYDPLTLHDDFENSRYRFIYKKLICVTAIEVKKKKKRFCICAPRSLAD